jgi:hypothetical protein
MHESAPMQRRSPAPASLVTGPAHDDGPAHETVHMSPWQLTPFGQLPSPEQLMSSTLPLPETLPAHVCGPAHSILHCAPPH